jgi:hypothetical protein
MSDDSTVDPATVPLEDSAQTILELARNVNMFGPISSSILKDPFENFSTSAASIFSGAFGKTGVLSASLEPVTQMLKDMGLSDLANNIDPGFGFNTASGQPSTQTGNMLSYGNIGTTPTAATVYDQLDTIVSASLIQEWKTKNATPRNPLILEAYALSGRSYEIDGVANEYNWNAAFTNWVLSKSGLQSVRNMSPQAFNAYGSPVDFGTFKNVRKNDIIIFKSMSNVGSIGFVRGYNPKTNKITVLGGNFGGTVKELQIPFSRTDPIIRVTHVRRNWAVPTDKDVPLFQTTLPTRPGQQTSGAATVLDRRAGVTGAASGGTLV